MQEGASLQFPISMRGCWELRQMPDEEFPDGLSATLTVEARRVVVDARGVDRQVGSIEIAGRLTPSLIEGRISTPEDEGRHTIATALELNPEGSPSGTLLLREGDAGSYNFTRCTAAKAEQSRRFSLVIARSGRQKDPKPAPCGAHGSCDNFLYRSEFSEARVIAGADLPRSFDARLTLHTPYISRYMLALIVERLDDGSLIVRRQAGFNGRTGVACFNEPGEWPVDWKPEDVAGIRYQRGELCYFDMSQIDPNAPKE